MKNAIVLLSVFLPAILLTGCKCNKQQVNKPALKPMGALRLEVRDEKGALTDATIRLWCDEHQYNANDWIPSRTFHVKAGEPMTIKGLPLCYYGVEVVKATYSKMFGSIDINAKRISKVAFTLHKLTPAEFRSNLHRECLYSCEASYIRDGSDRSREKIKTCRIKCTIKDRKRRIGCPSTKPHWNEDRGECEACPDDSYWDSETGKCELCPKENKPVRDMEDIRCKACPKETRWNMKRGQCEALWQD